MHRMTVFLGVALFGMATPALSETYVLVHGAFQTGADWATVADELGKGGNTVVVVDLPGRAGDNRAAAQITMSDHVAKLREAVATAARTDADRKVTLVGHSFGGMVISAVAEVDPAPIATLVYVAAYLPKTGSTPGDSMQELSMRDHHGGWKAESFVVAPDYATASVNPRDRENLFANDAEPAQAKAIASAMIDEPLAPLATQVALTDGRFGSVRKAYVVTLRDNAVSMDWQLTMLGRGTVDEAVPLNTGHSPQFTAPSALAAAIRRASTPDIE